jgi:hypothetical protein
MEDLSKGFPFLMEMKFGYKTSTANISWVQWNSSRLTGRGIYPHPFLMEMKVSRKISTAKKAKKIY